MQRKLKAVLAVAGLTLLVAACADGATDPQSDGSSEDDSIVLGVPTDVTGRERDPALTAGGTAIPFLFSVYDTLYAFDEAGEPQPNIVASDELSDDGLELTLQLEPGLAFHNGDPITAEDVKFSLDRARGADESIDGPTNTAGLASIDSIETPDETTVVLKLEDEDPILRNSLAYLGGMVVPADYIEEVGHDGFLANPVGSGPYTFAGEVSGQEIELAAFPEYQGDPQPSFESITMRILNESTARLAQLQAGDIDVAMDADVTQLEMLRNSGFNVTTNLSGQVLSVIFNVKTPALEDELVRQAFNYAIDREGIVETVYQGAASTVGSNDPTLLSGEGPDAYPYDPQRAEQLLADANFDLDRPLTLDYPTGRYPQDRNLMQVIQANLADVGVDVTLEPMDSGDWLDKLANKELDDMTLTLNANVNYDPFVTLSGNSTCEGPWSLWCDEDLDQTINAVAPLSGDERQRALADVNSQLNEDPLAIFLVNIHQAFAMRDGIEWTPVEGFRSGSLTNLRSTAG